MREKPNGTIESLRGPVDVSITSESVTRGDIVRHLMVTGVVQPATTVGVGTQVSGTIAEVDADFNSVVHTGQVLARLDESERQSELDQARSTLAEARTAMTQADADVRVASARVDEAAAGVRQANVSLQQTWAYDGTEFTPITIRTGLADDRWTELVSGPLEPGTTLVTNAFIGRGAR